MLRDYGNDMTMPALEVFTEGLLTDSTMLEAFAAHSHSDAEGKGEGKGEGNDSDFDDQAH